MISESRFLYSDSCTERANAGSVTFVQRFGSSLNLNPHMHVLMLDGVYVDNECDKPLFLPAPALTDKDVQKPLLAGITAAALRIITVLTDSASIRAYLTGVGLPPAPPSSHRRDSRHNSSSRPDLTCLTAVANATGTPAPDLPLPQSEQFLRRGHVQPDVPELAQGRLVAGRPGGARAVADHGDVVVLVGGAPGRGL